MINKNNSFIPPDWKPIVPPGSDLLVIGASGGIGSATIHMLSESESCVIGAQYQNDKNLVQKDNIFPIKKTLKTQTDCEELVNSFINKTKKINGLVILIGGISSNIHWSKLSDENWISDINLNLNIPFYLAQTVYNQMLKQGSGGKIIFTGTESALHGGGLNSLAYGVSKRATECLVQAMARDGASNNIIVNGIRMGFIDSGFHGRWQKKGAKELKQRAKLVPLKRSGTAHEVASLIAYLLSDWGNFITGQMIPITGGDWL